LIILGSMRRKVENWVLILLIVLIFPIAVFGQTNALNQEFKDLKSEYLTLRNTDPGIRKISKWVDLAEAFENFADKHPNYGGSPSGLFNASILYYELYEKFGGRDRLYKCVHLLERLAKNYQGHHFADDGLIKRGDIFLFELSDVEQARQSYLEVIDGYPDSDMYDLAVARIKSLESGEDQEEIQEKEPVAEERTVVQNLGKRPVILIDPGHGGEDFGAVGKGGLLEKDVVLAVALELEQLLEKKIGAVVHLTRRKDVFVPLADRTSLANDYEVDVFLSLHCNATESGRTSGLEVYYLDNKGDSASHKLAERENASAQFEGPQGDLQYMLSDLIQGAKQSDSIILANLISRSLYSYLKGKWPRLKNLGVKKAPFYVLVGAYMPCIIVEMFFINHEIDGKYLTLKDFRSDLAFGLYFSIKGYLEHQGWKFS
jgi:N-acetylmuramoyl-L-alanine amidase